VLQSRALLPWPTGRGAGSRLNVRRVSRFIATDDIEDPQFWQNSEQDIASVVGLQWLKIA
jgi:hypothetical protein